LSRSKRAKKIKYSFTFRLGEGNQVLKNQNNFRNLWLGYFINNIGSYLLIISITTHIYSISKSTTQSAWPIMLHWLPGLFLIFFASEISDRFKPQNLIRANSIIAAALTLSMLFFIEPFSTLLFPLIFLRGIFNQLTTSLRAVVVKTAFAPEEQQRLGPLFQTSLYLGRAVAGILAFLFINWLSLYDVILVDVATFLISFLLFSRVKAEKKYIPSGQGVSQVWKSISSAMEQVKGHQVLQSTFCSSYCCI